MLQMSRLLTPSDKDMFVYYNTQVSVQVLYSVVNMEKLLKNINSSLVQCSFSQNMYITFLH